MLKSIVTLSRMPCVRPHPLVNFCSFPVIEFGCHTWWSFLWLFQSLQLFFTNSHVSNCLHVLHLIILGVSDSASDNCLHVTRVRSFLCFQYCEIVTLSIWCPHLPCRSWEECSPPPLLFSPSLCIDHKQNLPPTPSGIRPCPLPTVPYRFSLLWTSLSSLGLKYVPIWVTVTVLFWKAFLPFTCLTVVQRQNLYSVSSPFFQYTAWRIKERPLSVII